MSVCEEKEKETEREKERGRQREREREGGGLWTCTSVEGCYPFNWTDVSLVSRIVPLISPLKR